MNEGRLRRLLIGVTLLSVIAAAIVFVKRGSAHRAKAREAAFEELYREVGHQIARYRGEASVVIKDLETGQVVVSHHPELRVPAAELALVPILAAGLQAVEEGRIKAADEIVMQDSDRVFGAGKTKVQRAGSRHRVDKLMQAMIEYDDTTAAHLIVQRLGVDYFRQAFGTYGLLETNLAREVGDHQALAMGLENYTTAAEMSALFERIYRGELVSRAVSKRLMELLKLTRTDDRIPRFLVQGTEVANMTGLESGLQGGVCHDVGIIFNPKGDVLVAVLTQHRQNSSIPTKRFIADIAKLAQVAMYKL